jgi:glycerol uptake facilitator-like aquaporin
MSAVSAAGAATAVAGCAGTVAPLAIGMALTFNILMGGALSGAAFNLALALGPMVATAISAMPACTCQLR